MISVHLSLTFYVIIEAQDNYQSIKTQRTIFQFNVANKFHLRTPVVIISKGRFLFSFSFFLSLAVFQLPILLSREIIHFIQ